jgi:hypothetical protein
MNRLAAGFLCVAACLAGTRLDAETIAWFSDAGKANLDGAGVAMDGAFHFELGVFSSGFEPTASNVGQWAAHWVVADSETYNPAPASCRFSGQFVVSTNNAPFTVGAKAWIFGYRNTPTGSETLLFRGSGWTWPAPNPMNPVATEWNAGAANEVVLGSINPGGAPFLMQSVSAQTYAQWQVQYLTGDPLDKPGDDPDHDGSPNLLEFVFGTPPKTAGAPAATPVALVGGHLQITIPRRSDHPAFLTVEVSSDLANWDSGASHTQTVSDGPAALVVRDLTPLDTDHPKRFIRLRAALP